ncbi:DegT/DnrJ/EryC1/StrS family aminotransferase [Mycolicibacterium hippocampi]|uniref:Uncharacterized protein n=1 Tax=Mycolicibacterium hippocampi TaxID=659824 RepID=A0A850PTV3_9MYCO|nr:DegT/DnrJ/EryC1/StrS family aminotransferase [Mycolicibacterium hippocampi]NVN53739.1 hypothetical protein [Mycolicibacterium hippocampi]
MNESTPPAGTTPRKLRGRHAPSGRAVPARAVRGFGNRDPGTIWADTKVCLLDSGTSALALAIRHCLIEVPPGATRRVALPAYACPSLVAATLWAGAKPLYYDLDGDLAPDRDGFAECLADEGTAIVHVDMFGADCYPPDHPRVIHDLAQSFAPYKRDWLPTARYTVVSTGRAKPVSLLRGGALLTRAGIVDASFAAEAATSKVEFALRAALYGLSMRPAVLGPLSSIPQLNVGRTEFSPLDDVRRMPVAWTGVFAAAVNQARGRFDTWRDETNSMLELAQQAGMDIPDAVSREANRLPLWRIPVLCPSPDAAAHLASQAWHLGVSRLYGQALPVIMGEAPEDAALQWPGASWIAERLVTLPAHGRLNKRERVELCALLRAHCGEVVR